MTPIAGAARGLSHHQIVVAAALHAAAYLPCPRWNQARLAAAAGSVVSLADRDQQLRHEAARRLAERHNAALRPPSDVTA